MNKLDISGWASFPLGGDGGLFDIVKGTRLTKAQMNPGDINYIGATAMNNGVTNRISNDEHVHPGNVLTVSYNGSVGEVFYQPEPFWASDDVNILYPRFELDECLAMFLAALIRKVGRNYRFVDKWKLDNMKADTIMLPVDDDGEPDWERMRSVSTEMVERSRVGFECLSQAGKRRHVVDSHDWRPFPIGGPGGLFAIEKGTRLTRADMREGTTPFIGASTANNGVTAYVGNDEHIHPGNVITVAYNGQKATGKAFYQPEPFWASDDVHVLYPNFELNELRAMFLLPIFRIVGEPYAFEDKWKIEFMEKDCLPLPVNDNGEPDWEYMECKMGKAIDAARISVDALGSL